ncbi:MAG: hypothetical protein LAT84_02245 [Balneolia bacterium]|nr:hypothetical protein [Balneolia bacterium]
MRTFIYSISILLLCFDHNSAEAQTTTSASEGLRFSFGADVFQNRQTEINGINALTLSYRFENGLYIGNSVYSAAFGTGGGFFVGGIEAGWMLPFSQSFGLQFGSFVGGGGGASQVSGDGLMLRHHLSAWIQPFGGVRIQPGVSHVSVSGSPISTMAYTLGISRDFDIALSGGHEKSGHPDGSFLRVAAFKPAFRQYIPQGSRMRGGRRELQTMNTLGAEVTFARTSSHEAFIQTYGVVSGDAEGYADWLIGYRGFLNLRPFRLSASTGFGTAGGGNVNTGGGMIFMGGLGLEVPLFGKFGAEIEAMGVSSFNGDFLTIAPGARLVRYLHHPFVSKDETTSYRWKANSGVVMHLPNSGYRKNPNHPNDPVYMIEAGMDLFLSDRFYVTGQAYTSFIGDAGGYQIGLLGPGISLPFIGRSMISGEIYIGAGGGAGVDTLGGLLTGARAEFSLPVWRALTWTAGAGTLSALLGRGMNPITLHTGMAIPFRSYH